MFKIIILDYSILVQHSRESALFSKKFHRQAASLGHAGSPCFLSFCYLRCIVLTCSILGSVYLKSTVNSKNALINAVVSWVVYTWDLRLTCKNALIIPVISWVVYTWNLQLTRKNALINAVVSWVVYTWNLKLTCKNALIIPCLLYTSDAADE